MKEIRLNTKRNTIGHNFVALVDDEDYERLNQYNWYADKGRHTYYAKRNITLPSGRQTSIKMHREIMGITGRWNFIDHKDGNGLNCQKYNLRNCTNDENIRNRKGNVNSTSQYKGVGRRVFKYTTKDGKVKEYVRFIVQIKQKHISLHESEIEAALKYNELAKKEFGEFAYLNKIYCNPCVVNSITLQPFSSGK